MTDSALLNNDFWNTSEFEKKLTGLEQPHKVVDSFSLMHVLYL